MTSLYRRDSPEKLKQRAIQAKQTFSNLEPLRNGKSFGVAANTIRAYRGFDAPLATYRYWANEFCNEELLVRLALIKSREAVVEFHTETVAKLNSFWNARQGHSLQYYQTNKLVDLLVKHIAKSFDARDAGVRDNLLQFGNVPLDKFSLLAVKELFYGIVISPSPSMGDVNDQETYEFLQCQIYGLTSAAGVPNLYFDHSWDAEHDE